MSNYKKQFKQLITWVLLALLVWVWVQFILFPKHKPSQIVAVTAPPSQLDHKDQRPPISSFHLFGSSSVSEIPLNLLQSESSLDLIITGIIASNEPAQGRAYIKNRQGDEKKFKVGDDVFGLATLDAVHDDYLVLKRAGKQEKLSLSKGHAINTHSQVKRGKAENIRAANSSRIANHINTSSDWQDMLNKQKYDANKIAKIAGNVSVIRDGQGQIAGLRVSQLAGNSSLLKQGLKPNDQIIEVNGVKISYQNILTLQKQLESSANANVTIKRNGRNINLKLNLSEFQ